MVPNIDITMGLKIKTRKHPRHGTQCVIQHLINRNPAQSLQENAITVFGHRMYQLCCKSGKQWEIFKTRHVTPLLRDLKWINFNSILRLNEASFVYKNLCFSRFECEKD